MHRPGSAASALFLISMCPKASLYTAFKIHLGELSSIHTPCNTQSCYHSQISGLEAPSVNGKYTLWSYHDQKCVQCTCGACEFLGTNHLHTKPKGRAAKKKNLLHNAMGTLSKHTWPNVRAVHTLIKASCMTLKLCI